MALPWLIYDSNVITVRQDAQRRIGEFNQLEEISWRQKSRVNSLKGDKNTTFFHRMASIRSRINYIGKIRHSGKVFESPHEIKEEVVWFMKIFLRVMLV